MSKTIVCNTACTSEGCKSRTGGQDPEGVLLGPDGQEVKGVQMCIRCAAAVILEYRVKLDEQWGFRIAPIYHICNREGCSSMPYSDDECDEMSMLYAQDRENEYLKFRDPENVNLTNRLRATARQRNFIKRAVRRRAQEDAGV